VLGRAWVVPRWYNILRLQPQAAPHPTADWQRHLTTVATTTVPPPVQQPHTTTQLGPIPYPTITLLHPAVPASWPLQSHPTATPAGESPIQLSQQSRSNSYSCKYINLQSSFSSHSLVAVSAATVVPCHKSCLASLYYYPSPCPSPYPVESTDLSPSSVNSTLNSGYTSTDPSSSSGLPAVLLTDVCV